MVAAAELGALAVVDAFAVGQEPGLVQAAGNGVDLEAERGHGEGVDNVGADHLHVDDSADRDDHLVVDRKQPRLRRRVGALGVGKHQRIELEFAVVGIGIGPVPLAPGRLDGDRLLRVVVGDRARRIVLGEQKRERRYSDTDEDQDRQHRPDDLDKGVVAGLRRHRIALGVELTITTMRSARTKTTISATTMSRPSLKLWIISMIGEPAGCSVISQGCGCVTSRGSGCADAGPASAMRTRPPSKTKVPGHENACFKLPSLHPAGKVRLRFQDPSTDPPGPAATAGFPMSCESLATQTTSRFCSQRTMFVPDAANRAPRRPNSGRNPADFPGSGIGAGCARRDSPWSYRSLARVPGTCRP